MDHSSVTCWKLFTNPGSLRLLRSLKKLQILNTNENPNWALLRSIQETIFHPRNPKQVYKRFSLDTFPGSFGCSSLGHTQPFQGECFSKWDAPTESCCWFQMCDSSCLIHPDPLPKPPPLEIPGNASTGCSLEPRQFGGYKSWFPCLRVRQLLVLTYPPEPLHGVRLRLDLS